MTDTKKPERIYIKISPKCLIAIDGVLVNGTITIDIQDFIARNYILKPKVIDLQSESE